ncbi:MmcQ/YjbR family DNA-binding protein [Deinococcus rubellus]|uniref:MmcQ/YjbR family DNA-binding protein n=1 Tax=Deinococcus rubellus TaxID=1889240 RepID=A0ABY5YIY5_9DEIO|nr:MmcQ/YjbR family DNA-binding protein [Deinococcus rubellus]UWX64312.1 MmcQ/YjbR family DNA-binding protein [Deinococcus rubellus]
MKTSGLDSVAAVRAECAALPHSRETFPFGEATLVFKVGGKMYALTDIHADSLSLSLKVLPERGEALRTAYPAITPGDHLNKRHWITLRLDAVPDALARELLTDSYALVLAGLTRAQRAELATGGPGLESGT